MFSFGHGMIHEKIIIIKVGFCKTFEINKIVNPIITPFSLYQMRWLDGNDKELTP
jgi:hypothetical protein